MKATHITLALPVILCCVFSACTTQPPAKPVPLDAKTLSGTVWNIDLKAKRKSQTSYTITATSKSSSNSEATVREAWSCAADQLANGKPYDKTIKTKPEYYFVADNGKISPLSKSLDPVIGGGDYDRVGLPGGEQHRMWTANGSITIK